MWVSYNANPTASRVGDCTVRAISKVMEQEWAETYMDLALEGLKQHDMPSSNAVWGSYLNEKGYTRQFVCPRGQTVREFASTHPHGRFVLAISGHVVACCDGNYYDTWDSGDEIPLYYWEKEN